MSSSYSDLLLDSQREPLSCSYTQDPLHEAVIPRFVVEKAFIALREIALGTYPFEIGEICVTLRRARIGYDSLSPGDRINAWSKGDLRRLLTLVAERYAPDMVPPRTEDTLVTEAEAFKAFRGLQSASGYRGDPIARYSDVSGEMELEVQLMGEEELGDALRYLSALVEAHELSVPVATLTRVELARFVNRTVEGDPRLREFHLAL